jgi:hypothetical protein
MYTKISPYVYTTVYYMYIFNSLGSSQKRMASEHQCANSWLMFLVGIFLSAAPLSLNMDVNQMSVRWRGSVKL